MFDAVAGVEPQTETVWRQAIVRGPPMRFINKMDRTGANFKRTVEMIVHRLQATPLNYCSSRGAMSPTSLVT